MAGAGCECPWVRRPRRRPAADASSLISHPRTLTPGIPTFTVAVGAKQKQEPCLSGRLRSDRPVRPAGLWGCITGEASAARRLPEDLRPEGQPTRRGTSADRKCRVQATSVYVRVYRGVVRLTITSTIPRTKRQ